MTNAAEINALLAEGKKVTIRTYRGVMSITPKVAAAWVDAGFPMFRDSEDGVLEVIAGQSKGNPRYVGLATGTFAIDITKGRK